jgi:uncharacterized protein
MPLLVNLRQLATREISLKGQLAASELDIDSLDEMIRVQEPLQYDLVVQKLDENILVRGSLQIGLACQCVRCLRPFRQEVKLRGGICELPLQGEEAVRSVNDCVDLTPYLREDILLEFPQHPVCERDCPGMSADLGEAAQKAHGTGPSEGQPSAWAELNKLKL